MNVARGDARASLKIDRRKRTDIPRATLSSYNPGAKVTLYPYFHGRTLATRGTKIRDPRSKIVCGDIPSARDSFLEKPREFYTNSRRPSRIIRRAVTVASHKVDAADHIAPNSVDKSESVAFAESPSLRYFASDPSDVRRIEQTTENSFFLSLALSAGGGFNGVVVNFPH